MNPSVALPAAADVLCKSSAEGPASTSSNKSWSSSSSAANEDKKDAKTVFEEIH